MRNIFIIAIIVASVAYMFVVLANKYQSIKATNTQIEQQNK
ncbi:MAG: hypothetical protein ACNI28_12655 [Arcobacter sp.]